MIRRFCEVCGNEMPNDATQVRVLHKTWTSGDAGEGPDKRQVHIELKITRALNGTWNGGDVCIGCIREAVANGEISALIAGAV